MNGTPQTMCSKIESTLNITKRIPQNTPIAADLLDMDEQTDGDGKGNRQFCIFVNCVYKCTYRYVTHLMFCLYYWKRFWHRIIILLLLKCICGILNFYGDDTISVMT
jgi:hypothetical protein